MDNLQQMKILYIVLIVFAAVLLLGLIGLIFLFLSKKKVRFYQIRLKRINRVNSSKMGVKPQSDEEIAD